MFGNDKTLHCSIKTLSQKWITQQDNNTQYTNCSTERKAKTEEFRVLQRLSQSPGFNPTEMLWKDQK